MFLRVPPGFILVMAAARWAGEMSEEYQCLVEKAQHQEVNTD